MAVDLLPDGPDPAVDPPAVFSQKAAASVIAQKNMVGQFNAALGQFNAAMAGGVYALPYTFDAATADSDPGAGFLRLSSAAQNASTTLRLDLNAGGQDVTSLLDTFDASSSNVKGSIRLVKLGDMSKWLTFDVTARATPSGYRNMTVVNTGGSSASPFAASDSLLLFFQRNGDIGVGASVFLLGTANITAAVANIDFLNLFSSGYDKYIVEVACTGASNDFMRMSFANAGVIDGNTRYYGTVGNGATSTAATSVVLENESAGGTNHCATIEIRNANVAGTNVRGISVRGSNGVTSGAFAGEGMYVGPSLSGLRLFLKNGSNFTGGIVRVFGIKNS